MATSANGGQTWTTVRTGSTGLQIRSFESTNGGSTWSTSVTVATVQAHTVAGNLRTSPLPSAAMDSSS